MSTFVYMVLLTAGLYLWLRNKPQEEKSTEKDNNPIKEKEKSKMPVWLIIIITIVIILGGFYGYLRYKLYVRRKKRRQMRRRREKTLRKMLR